MGDMAENKGSSKETRKPGCRVVLGLQSPLVKHPRVVELPQGNGLSSAHMTTIVHNDRQS